MQTQASHIAREEHGVKARQLPPRVVFQTLTFEVAVARTRGVEGAAGLDGAVLHAATMQAAVVHALI